MLDYIVNGQGQGSVASRLLQANMDPGVLRPFISGDGRSLITLNQNGVDQSFVTNTTSMLRKDDWLILDEAVVKAAKPRLRAVGDLRSAGLQYTIPNGMSKTVLQYERQTDINGATISMDGLRKGESDRPLWDLNNLPLPIIHKDFKFSLRQVAASRNGGSPLDTTTAELAARRVAEEAEQLLLGTTSSYTYGGGSIYGYTNFPGRLTKAMTNPTTGGYSPSTTLNEVLAMKLQSQLAFHYGPWVIYSSPLWDVVLDGDYTLTGGNVTTSTLRARLKQIDGITDVRTLDYLTGYQIILVQQTSDTARIVVGMDIVTVQWETEGGMELNFKVMCIMVPQLRSDINGNCGIVHGSA